MSRKSKRKQKRKQRALARKQKSAAKSLTYGNSWSYPTAISQSVDINRNKWGAAIAYAQVHQINICTAILVNSISGLRWDLVNFGVGSGDDGKVVASSEDQFPKTPFMLAMRDFRHQNGQSLLSTIMFDRTVYGEVFLERTREIEGNHFGHKTLDWLNPLGVTVEVDRTGIISFRYGWQQDYFPIAPGKVAYQHTRNPFDDFTGYSRVMAVMAKINVERNMDRFLRDFFQNNAIPGMIIQPSGQAATFSPPDQLNIETKVREQVKGLGNQFRTLVLPHQADIKTLDNPNLDNQYGIESRISVQIFEGMGVPQVLAGNAGATTFKDSDDTSRWFFFNTVLPEAREIEQYINVQVMPFFDPAGKTVFRFDTSAFDETTQSDQLEANVVNSQLTGGYLALAEAARIQERPVAEWMEGRYMIEGVPMTPAQIDSLVEAKIAGAQAAAQPLPAFPLSLPPEDEPDAGLPSEPDEPDEPDEEDLFGDVPPGLPPQKDNAVADDFDYSAFDWLKVYEGDELFPDEHVIDGRMLDELEQWSRFIISKWGKKDARPFVTTVLPPFVRHVVIDRLDGCTNKHDAREAFKGILEDDSLKTIRTYQSGLRKLGRSLWNESISGSAFENEQASLINVEFEGAFKRGFKRAGVPISEMTSDDLSTLDGLIADETSHVSGLRQAIEKSNQSAGGNLASVRARVDRWVSRFVGIEEQGFVTAMRDEPITWKWNPAKEHCFPEGTMVKIYNGEKPIERIRVGDSVYAGDGLHKVTRLWQRDFEGDLFELKQGNNIVKCTPNHPFLTQRGWIRADGLQPSDYIMVFEDIHDGFLRHIRFPNARYDIITGMKVFVLSFIAFLLSFLSISKRFKSWVSMPIITVGLNDEYSNHTIDNKLRFDNWKWYIGDGQFVNGVQNGEKFKLQLGGRSHLPTLVSFQQFLKMRCSLFRMRFPITAHLFNRLRVEHGIIDSHVGGGGIVNQRPEYFGFENNPQNTRSIKNLFIFQPHKLRGLTRAVLGIQISQFGIHVWLPQNRVIHTLYAIISLSLTYMAATGAITPTALTLWFVVFLALWSPGFMLSRIARVPTLDGTEPLSVRDWLLTQFAKLRHNNVLSIHSIPTESIPVYNLEVQGNPQYFANSFLVHNCVSCTKLNGKTYRASKWAKIGIWPRSSKLDCFGIFCGCGWFTAEDKPISRGRVPNIAGTN